MSNLPSRLKKLRRDRKMNQDELGDLVGVTRRQISGYETGETNPSLETLILLANLYDTTVDYMLGLTDNPTRDPSYASELNPTQQRLLDLIDSRDEDFHQKLLTIAEWLA